MWVLKCKLITNKFNQKGNFVLVSNLAVNQETRKTDKFHIENLQSQKLYSKKI